MTAYDGSGVLEGGFTVADGRKAIEDPMCIDYFSMPVPALKFLVAPSYTPMGIVETLLPGLTACHTPWFTELALEVTGVPNVAVALLYVIPKDDDTSLLAACLDEHVEPLFGLMSGADFGDEVTNLVALHWPEIYSMFLHSQRGTAGQRVLAKVRTPSKVQWVVADELRGVQRGEWDPQHARQLIAAALETLSRVSSFPVELPGLIRVLGGPDRLSRRLKAVPGILSSGADLGSGIMNGIQADELVDLAKGAREFVLGVRDLKD